MEHWQVLSNRLDQKGMDACRVRPAAQGWVIEGTAVFGDDENGIANLSYRLLCESDWRTREAEVHGWISGRDWSLRLAKRPNGIWTVSDHPINLTDGLLEVDLGFTPESNVNAIRRLALGIGEKAETMWLDTADRTVKPLAQTYERVFVDSLHLRITAARIRDRVDG